jgi:hypothetical protein
MFWKLHVSDRARYEQNLVIIIVQTYKFSEKLVPSFNNFNKLYFFAKHPTVLVIKKSFYLKSKTFHVFIGIDFKLFSYQFCCLESLKSKVQVSEMA